MGGFETGPFQLLRQEDGVHASEYWLWVLKSWFQSYYTAPTHTL